MHHQRIERTYIWHYQISIHECVQLGHSTSSAAELWCFRHKFSVLAPESDATGCSFNTIIGRKINWLDCTTCGSTAQCSIKMQKTRRLFVEKGNFFTTVHMKRETYG
jgi:hypothetical protein